MKCGSSFHEPWNDRMVSVISAGRAIGSTTDQKVRNAPAPSSRADSSTSTGMTDEELPHDEHPGRVRQQRDDHAGVAVVDARVAPSTRYLGISSTTPGTAMIAMNSAEQPRPAAKLQPGQGISGQRVEEHPADGDAQRDDHRVHEPQREIRAAAANR